MFSVVALCGLLAVESAAQERGFLNRVYRDDAGEHKYVLFVPHDYTADREWPVLLFLHGAGERGTDGQLQTKVGLGPAIQSREKTFPFIVVLPQAEDRQGPIRRVWYPESPDGKRALAMFAEVEKAYRIDKDREYLTGLSMGGYGTWAHAAAAPDRWAAIAPICGGGDPDWAEKIAQLPIWCFHGADDRVVLADESRQMIEALKKASGNPQYTEYPGIGHNSWDRAYGTDELYTWLLKHRRGKKATDAAPAAIQPVARITLANPEAPFIPALDVSRAVFIRLGREMLDALGDSLPFVVAADALRGTLPDVQDRTDAEGIAFQVQLSGLTYAASLSRVVIEPQEQNRLAVTMMFRLNVMINRTQLIGDGRSATCGPILIQLGHRRDLPIRFVLEPTVDDRNLKLKVVEEETQFRLTADNWTVSAPQWVRAAGLGMNEDRVSRGVRDGLAGDPRRIERQVTAAVPRLVGQLEERLRLDRVDQIVAGMWPLPVYKPRLRTWPSEVRTDADGATVVLGVSVAALTEEQAKAGPRTIDLAGTGSAAAVGGRQFQFGIAPGLMAPLCSQLIDIDAARVFVLDTPMKQLAPLADAAWLAEVVPGLKARGAKEVRSELVLSAPIRMDRAQADAAAGLVFEMPKLKCVVSVRANPESSEWSPYLEVEFGLSQVAQCRVAPSSLTQRVLDLGWQGTADLEVRARFAGQAPATTEIDTGRIRDVLIAGWREWTELGSLAQLPLDDMDLGFARLRADSVSWQEAFLSVGFAPPGVQLDNRGNQPVSYRLKGPFSEWSEPYTLGPDQSHRFGVASPLTCQFQSSGGAKEYTLSPGSTFEFQATSDGQLDLFGSDGLVRGR
jgi:pimeloyl-ACP methyl ester carboxylesterase